MKHYNILRNYDFVVWHAVLDEEWVFCAETDTYSLITDFCAGMP
jgi:hypothetical protein